MKDIIFNGSPNPRSRLSRMTKSEKSEMHYVQQDSKVSEWGAKTEKHCAQAVSKVSGMPDCLCKLSAQAVSRMSRMTKSEKS
ncbi:MAG: hypothetical protein WCV67_09215 [Victivallaceae bacterium]